MADKMWAGRQTGQNDVLADEFNSSIAVDSRMVVQDITGSMAHATMLGAKGIIPKQASEQIVDTLGDILEDIQSGKLAIDMSAEDVHMFVEAELTKRLGDAGKMLHTARSRNDQVAVDLRMYLRDEGNEIVSLLQKVIAAIVEVAEANVETIMPGYTHLQRAQPVTFAHYLSAYGMMLCRDVDRVRDAVKRMNVCPLGSCALAGTTYPIDRAMTAKALGFDAYCLNSMDGVSDRDFCVELLGAFATIMMHLSRLSEELILWSSLEFGFITLSDAYTTGSSIMPQKKNSDMAELIRGKTGRVYGDLMAMLTTLKGIPLAYNKDMQEDKEAIFDAVDTVKLCLGIMAPMLATMNVHTDKMFAAVTEGFVGATDMADYLTKKGMPFRAAYKIVGALVGKCVAEGKTLEQIELAEYQQTSELFDEDIYTAINPKTCIAKRISAGSTGPDSFAPQAEFMKKYINL